MIVLLHPDPLDLNRQGLLVVGTDVELAFMFVDLQTPLSESSAQAIGFDRERPSVVFPQYEIIDKGNLS